MISNVIILSNFIEILLLRIFGIIQFNTKEKLLNSKKCQVFIKQSEFSNVENDKSEMRLVRAKIITKKLFE
jgi:hypothetical protein